MLFKSVIYIAILSPVYDPSDHPDPQLMLFFLLYTTALETLQGFLQHQT